MAAGKIRRLDAREAALALERLEQRRLLAADVGPGAGVHHHVEAEARAEDVRADRAVRVGLVEGLLQPLEPEGELAAQVDEGLADLEGVGRDQHALEDLVRVALYEHVVLEGRRLRLVAVDDEVGQRVLAQHRPLAPGREAGAAPPEQAGRVDLGRHRLGRHGQRLAQRLVAAGGQVALNGVAVVVAEARRNDFGGVRDGHGLRLFSAAWAARAVWASAAAARSRTMAWRSTCRPAAAAHAHQRAVGRHGVGQPAGAQVVEQLVEALGRLRAHVAVVDLHAGRAVAVGQALGFVQREDAVGRRPAGPDAERRLRRARAARARHRACRRCSCRPTARRCRRARRAACRRRWPCPAPRPRSRRTARRSR